MIQRFNRASLYWGVPGVVLQILGVLIQVAHRIWGPPNTEIWIGMFLLMIGTLLLLVGLAYYAKAKGRSPAWCLLAFLGLPGWIAMVLILSSLPDLSEGQRLTTG